MPHSRQARKRVRQSEKRRLRNKAVRSEIKTLMKTLASHVAAKDAENAQALFRKLTSKLDKAAKTHVYHKNAVARRKSKAASLVRSLLAAQGTSSGSPTPA